MLSEATVIAFNSCLHLSNEVIPEVERPSYVVGTYRENTLSTHLRTRLMASLAEYHVGLWAAMNSRRWVQRLLLRTDYRIDAAPSSTHVAKLSMTRTLDCVRVVFRECMGPHGALHGGDVCVRPGKGTNAVVTGLDRAH